MSIGFIVPDEDEEKANEWLEKHRKICKVDDVGAIGGKYTWSFIQTGLGLIIILKCFCGEEINLTDYESW